VNDFRTQQAYKPTIKKLPCIFNVRQFYYCRYLGCKFYAHSLHITKIAETTRFAKTVHKDCAINYLHYSGQTV